MLTKIFKHQLWHALSLVILLLFVKLLTRIDGSALEGELWGIGTYYWFMLAIASPIVHQLYVLLCWRLELHNKSISNLFGEKGFKFYKVGFALLIVSRPVSVVLLAISNRQTIDISLTYAFLLSGILLIPSIYLFYSVFRYFEIDRAFGKDHFRPEEFMNKPLVKQGIFKYTSNGMYLFGFLILWIPGLLLQSEAALIAALFNHIYIWVHYYFTELPDMKVIYGGSA